jgi:arylsulfatase A-like enzyme
MAVRSGDWKYHRELKAPTKGRGKTQTAALYNLKTDIGESKDVLAEHPDVGQRLEELCAKFDLGIQADVLKRRRSSGKPVTREAP